MSNGVRVCCLAGICCTPEEQAIEWAKLLFNAVQHGRGGDETRSFEQLSPTEQAVFSIAGKYILSKLDPMPVGFMGSIIDHFGPLFKAKFFGEGAADEKEALSNKVKELQDKINKMTKNPAVAPKTNLPTFPDNSILGTTGGFGLNDPDALPDHKED